MVATTRGINKSLMPSARTRVSIAKRLAGVTGAMTTVTVAEMESRHHWFRRLDAEHRSWITLVAQAGIDGFVKWFASPEPRAPSTADIFGSAPRELARRISLYQTVELVRTTIDVVESQIDEVMPKADRPFLHAAIVQYSREVAFSAAEVYARAAELRGAWDERLEALVVDAVLRERPTRRCCPGPRPWAGTPRPAWWSWSGRRRTWSRRWRWSPSGTPPPSPAPTCSVPSRATGWWSCSAAPAWPATEHALVVVGKFAHLFGPGAVVVGPPVEHLMDAAASTREALAGYRAAAGWPEAPRPVAADDLLPERALSGDGHARRTLAKNIYDPLFAAGGGLLETLVTFLDQGLSVEAAARSLFVHANTVRYRLRRIHEVTGYSPTDPRDAYALAARRDPGPAAPPEQERGAGRQLGNDTAGAGCRSRMSYAGAICRAQAMLLPAAGIAVVGTKQ